MGAVPGFEGIRGHADVLGSLARSLAGGAPPHAIILHGPSGVGKRTIARAFVRSLLCADRRPDGSACGVCVSCRLFGAGTHPDFYAIAPENDVIKVDRVREMQADIILNPMYSPRKACLIEDADRMNVQAQNCLLKTLEEPPEQAMILLTLESPAKMLETIRSRAIGVYVGRNTREEVLEHLRENVPGLKDAEFIAHYAEGSIGRALKACADERFPAMRAEVSELALKMRGTPARDAFDGMDVLERNKEDIGDALEILALVFRDLLVLAQTRDGRLLINTDKKDIIAKIAGQVPAARWMAAIGAVEAAADAIRRNGSFNATMEVLLLRLQKELNDG